MERLDFKLPDFTRVMWVSEKARQVWEPRLHRIALAWMQIERLSVLEGVRAAALQQAPPELLPELARWAFRNGLVAVPIRLTGACPTYQATPKPVEPGKPFDFMVVFARPDVAAALPEAHDPSHHGVVGKLLGYPQCCRTFFHDVWVAQQFVDTTWPMAERTPGAQASERTIDIKGTPPESNILLRWIGVRAVPHMPHSFSCEQTVAFGQKLLALGEASGFAEEVGWIREMLRWPVEWSALHGIAEIKTPVLKVSARTDATGEKYVVRYHGDAYPDEGARGLVFPFRLPTGRKLTETASYRKALEPGPGAGVGTAANTATNSPTTQQVVELSAVPRQAHDHEPIVGTPAYYRDNGFASLEAQERAHEVVLAAVVQACRGFQQPKVLDLGCGNGALLAKAQARIPGLVAHGVEINAKAARHWFSVVLGSPNIWQGDLFAYPFPESFDVTLLMPGRLLDRPPEEARAFFERLRANTQRLVIYAYGDWLRRYGGLRELWAATGMPGQAVVVSEGDGAAAGVVTFDAA